MSHITKRGVKFGDFNNLRSAQDDESILDATSLDHDERDIEYDYGWMRDALSDKGRNECENNDSIEEKDLVNDSLYDNSKDSNFDLELQCNEKDPQIKIVEPQSNTQKTSSHAHGASYRSDFNPGRTCSDVEKRVKLIQKLRNSLNSD